MPGRRARTSRRDRPQSAPGFTISGEFVEGPFALPPPALAVGVRAVRDVAPAARRQVLVLAGTRPECIKLAPVVRALERRPGIAPIVVNSGQHPEAVRRTFAEFRVTCDLELPALPPAHNLGHASRTLVREIDRAIRQVQPAAVIVQGDTLTAYAGARATAASGCRVVHVEAGLRAPTARDPFPEEWFRRRIARHADVHFAPCDSAHANLLAEGTPPERIHRVGNTGIDSLRSLLAQHPMAPEAAPHRVLVTLHRRENWDERANVVCDALIELAAAQPHLRFLLPVHPNPRIATRLRKRLGSHPQFDLAAPLAYREFITAAATAALVISDSGGIQEEIPHLGVPLLVPRSCTERPEGVATGFVRIVNVDRESIVREALSMLAAPRRQGLPFDEGAPFGDGLSAMRIANVLESMLAETVTVQ